MKTKDELINQYFDEEKGFGLHKVQIALVKNMMQEYADQFSNPVEHVAGLASDPKEAVQIAEIVEMFGLDCTNKNNCANDGTLSEHSCDGTEKDCARTCPVPVQCEFCYCEPKSKFNLKLKLDELVNKYK